MKLYSKLQQMHFSSDRTNKSSAFRIEAQLAEPIRDDILLEALKKAMELFPSTACRPVIAADKKHVGMIPNDVPPGLRFADSCSSSV